MAHVGHFSRCRAISNLLEGTFCERMAEGAFTRTIEEKRDQIRCLFHHGGDPSVGFKPFGVIERVEPDTKKEVALVVQPQCAPAPRPAWSTRPNPSFPFPPVFVPVSTE